VYSVAFFLNPPGTTCFTSFPFCVLDFFRIPFSPFCCFIFQSSLQILFLPAGRFGPLFLKPSMWQQPSLVIGHFFPGGPLIAFWFAEDNVTKGRQIIFSANILPPIPLLFFDVVWKGRQRQFFTPQFFPPPFRTPVFPLRGRFLPTF